MTPRQAFPTALLLGVLACAGKQGAGSGNENGGASVTVRLPGDVVEFSLPSGGSEPTGIAAGPDGNIWFTESASSNIGCITMDGQVTEYPIPTANSGPQAIAVGPDGNLWFTESVANQIGRIDRSPMSGACPTIPKIAEFPTSIEGGAPFGITAGEGVLYFAELEGNAIGVIQTSGSVAALQTQIPTSAPENVAVDAAGNIWFAGRGGLIGRVSPDGGVFTVSTFPVLMPVAGDNYAMTIGPDSNLWFTEQLGNLVARMGEDGAVLDYPLKNLASQPNGIAPGPDGNLWITEGAGRIGCVTPSGVLKAEFQLPTGPSEPFGITAGPDGNLWFTERASSKIGSLVP